MKKRGNRLIICGKTLRIRKFAGILIYVFCLTVQPVLAQPYTSRNNYTGSWETPGSWNPVWTVPQTIINGYDIVINGYITLGSSLTFSGTSGNLIINDTLIIKGDLELGNNNNVTINDNGILIVRGNVTISNQTGITVNGYLIITGDLIKASSILQGFFTSNDNPVKVFIGGTISSVGLTTNNLSYPALNCISPVTTPWPHTTCSYGNLTDLENDPIYPFFQSTCAIATVTNNSPVCAGDTIRLTASGGSAYSWSGPAGFTSNLRNPFLATAGASMAGTYKVIITAATGCTVKDTVVVNVNALPVAVAGSNSPVCEGDTLNLTSSGGISYTWSGPNNFTSALQNLSIPNSTPPMSGLYTVLVKGSDGCTGKADADVTVNPLPAVTITSSSNPMCVNDSRTLTATPDGGSYIISGRPGNISGNVLTATGAGNIDLEYDYTGLCSNKAVQTIAVSDLPVPVAGPDQILKFTFETRMNAELSSDETGEWSLISGTGSISDVNSPAAIISDLSIGENIFLWRVKKAGCEAASQVKITVNDLFIPSVFTPNNDGKNDFFDIGETSGHVEIVIFNQWGNEEYSTDNYLNDWSGRNNKGAELPDDTYFYIIKFEKGQVKKGSILIKR